MNDVIYNLLFEYSHYMVAFFDQNNNLIKSNNRFKKVFPCVKDFSQLDKIAVSKKDTGNFKRIVVGIDNVEELIKFEIAVKDDYKLVVGSSVNIDDLLALFELKNQNEHCLKVPGSDQCINVDRLSSFCTLMVDLAGNIRYFSDNSPQVLGTETLFNKNLNQVFGPEFMNDVEEKIFYLDAIQDISFEYEHKLIVISRYDDNFILITIYPFSNSANSKFEEISKFKYRLEQCEKKLKQKEKFITIQKDIIRSIKTTDPLTKLNNSDVMKEEMKLVNSSVVIRLDIKQPHDIVCRYGLEGYDMYVRHIADYIRSSVVIYNDRIYRIGKSSFAIVLDTAEFDVMEDHIKNLENLQEELKEKDIELEIVKIVQDNGENFEDYYKRIFKGVSLNIYE